MTAATDIRDRLSESDFPPGLLPDAVSGLDYDEATGRFTLTLTKAMKGTVGGFTVLYDQTLTGTISKGLISDLGGVKVKVAILKPPVTEIAMSPSGEKVVFTVAGGKKAFPKSEFAEPKRTRASHHDRRGSGCVRHEAPGRAVKGAYFST